MYCCVFSQIRCFYDDVEIKGGPVEYNVSPDISKVKVTSNLGAEVMIGVSQELKVTCLPSVDDCNKLAWII